MPGISSLLHHISSQGNDQPARVDNSCQNRSIIGSGIPEKAFVKSTIGVPSLSPPRCFPCSHLFSPYPRSEHLKQASLVNENFQTEANLKLKTA